MGSEILFLSIFTVCGIKQGYGMGFSVSPGFATESLTTNVTFSCRTDIEDPGTKAVVMMQLTKGETESLVFLRYGAKVSYETKKAKRLEPAGNIDNVALKAGYLNVTMHYPTHQDTGMYRCHVVYLDTMGIISHYSKDVYLDVDESIATKMDASLRSLENRLYQMSEKMAMMEVNISTSRSKDPIHGFSAAISRIKYSITKSMTLVFNEIITMQGQGYNPHTGIFTAPVNGLYAFFLVLEMETKETGAGFSLRSGDRELARLYVEDGDYGDQSSVSSVVDLHAGQSVRVIVSYKTEKTGYLYHNKYCVFSGFLIRSM